MPTLGADLTALAAADQSGVTGELPRMATPTHEVPTLGMEPRASRGGSVLRQLSHGR